MEEYCKIKSGQAWDLLSSPKSSFCGSRSTIYSIPRLACYSHSPDLLECKLRMSSRRAAKPFSQQSQTQASGGGGGTGGRLLCSLLPSFHPLLLLPTLGQSAVSAAPMPASSSHSSLPWPMSTPMKPGPEGWLLPDLPSQVSGPLGPSIWITRLLTFNAGLPRHPAPGHTPQATILRCHFTVFWGLPGLCDFGALSPLIIGDVHPEGSAHLCGLQCCVRAINQPGFRSGSWVAKVRVISQSSKTPLPCLMTSHHKWTGHTACSWLTAHALSPEQRLQDWDVFLGRWRQTMASSLDTTGCLPPLLTKLCQ